MPSAAALQAVAAPSSPGEGAGEADGTAIQATVTDAAQRAARLSVRVDALHRRAESSLGDYEDALDRLSTAMATANRRSGAAIDSEQAARDAQLQWDRRIRAIYTTGGAVPLYAPLFGAADAGDAIDLLGVADQVLTADASAVRAAQQRSRSAQLSARSTVAATDALLLATRQTRTAADAVAADLKAEEAVLRTASADVQRLMAARTARLAATRRQAARAQLRSPSTPAVLAAPPGYLQLYREAAGTCPGLDWRVLAAIGQVESGHGRNTGTSTAGARGPMQFMPATFAAYGVDGDGDGDREITSPADAIHSAANYLCGYGAGSGQLEAALWHYNHAQWYVDLIVRLAQSYDA